MKSFFAIVFSLVILYSQAQIPRSGSGNPPVTRRSNPYGQPVTGSKNPVHSQGQIAPPGHMGLWDEQGNPRAYNFPGPRTNAPSYYNEFSLFQKQFYDLLYTAWINASENARKAETGLRETRERLEIEKNTVPIHAWRLVEGEVVYVKATNSSFVPVTGKVIEIHPDGVLADVGRYYPARSETCFIAGFPFEVVDGQELGEFWVRHVGRKSFTTVLGATRTVTLLDYGKPCPPPANSNDVQRAVAKLSPAVALDVANMEKKCDSAHLYADETRQKLEAYVQGIIGPRLKAKEAAAKQREEAALKNLNWNLQEAERGNAYGLLRMGERYRDGDGVEKDLGKAREYLQKAQKAGSAEAAGALQKLEAIETGTAISR